jgi:hypothetical protein
MICKIRDAIQKYLAALEDFFREAQTRKLDV